MKKYKKIFYQNNFCSGEESISLQILGFCPIFLVTNTVMNAFIFSFFFVLILLFISLIASIFRSHIMEFDFHTVICTFIILLTVFLTQNFFEYFSAIWFQNFWRYFCTFVFFSNCIFLERIKFSYTKDISLHLIIDNFQFGWNSLKMFLFIGMFREIFERGSILTDMKILFETKMQEILYTQIFSKGSYIFFPTTIRTSVPVVFMLLGIFFAIKKFFIKLNNRNIKNGL